MSGAAIVSAVGGASGGFFATASPTSTTSTKATAGSQQTSVSIVANPFGGLPPYTYAWTLVSGNPLVYPVSPTAVLSKFAGTSFEPDVYTAVYKCVITDSVGSTADTNNVTIELRWT